MHTLSQFDAKPNEGPAFGFGLDLEILPPAKPSLLVLVSLSLAPVMLLSFIIAIVFYVSRGPVSHIIAAQRTLAAHARCVADTAKTRKRTATRTLAPSLHLTPAPRSSGLPLSLYNFFRHPALSLAASYLSC